MKEDITKWIWQHKDYPNFIYLLKLNTIEEYLMGYQNYLVVKI